MRTLTDSNMTPEQSRAARAWLGWSQRELATRAGVSLSTVQDFERGQRTPISNNLAALRRAIQGAGVRLVFDRKGAAGILRQDADEELSDDAPA
jgi:transcriptional regulator with XRE-family HTH domain